MQNDSVYKDSTTFIITTDHGRGTIPIDTWRGHGSDVDGADEVFNITVEAFKVIICPVVQNVRVRWCPDRIPEALGPLRSDFRIGQEVMGFWLVLRLELFRERVDIMVIQQRFHMQ